MPIGTSAAIARIATNSVGVHDRTAKVSTVIAAPATAVISHVRPPSVSTRNRPSCAPNSGPRPTAGLKVLTNVKKPVVAAATVKTAAETDAMSSAASNSRSPAFRVNSAVTSAPTMPAAARLTASVAVGQPPPHERAGSPIANGAAPPPTISPQISVASATTTRIAGPAARSARGELRGPRLRAARGRRVKWRPGSRFKPTSSRSRGRSGTDRRRVAASGGLRCLAAAVRRNS